MTEFWKSGARHWCTYCKIFINGTKPSIAYHENGKKHKEIKEMYLKDMRMKARERGKEQKELQGELAKIEREALKQYQRQDAAGASSGARAPPPESADRTARLAALEAQIQASKLLRSGVGPGGLPLGWRMQTNPDGAVYYEHIETGAAQWEPPPCGAAAEEPEGEGGLPPGWRAHSNPDGAVYYEHVATGEMQWEKPGAAQEEAADAGASSSEAGTAASGLPEGWQQGESEDGTSYYFNVELGKTQWCVVPKAFR